MLALIQKDWWTLSSTSQSQLVVRCCPRIRDGRGENFRYMCVAVVDVRGDQGAEA